LGSVTVNLEKKEAEREESWMTLRYSRCLFFEKLVGRMFTKYSKYNQTYRTYAIASLGTSESIAAAAEACSFHVLSCAALLGTLSTGLLGHWFHAHVTLA